ncbi:hypothetical protein P691DRAFT_482145 [Macrolepiota fuliginosa MF-IS2]|uniref:Uncharacterized protein n=1 Tax=Macrolepiota fuliginosa MF-IS2 TaxID=1400762 RepID=A0A9P5XF43_9AGAR|nr:hypothetical protein P691DRAFT_482145 [Macrolepiota fuliginosa MF-IS2]
MVISLLPNLTSVSGCRVSSAPSFALVLQECQEPEPKPEPVVRKRLPPALSFGGVVFTRSPSEDLPSLDVVVNGEEPGVVEGVLYVREEVTECRRLGRLKLGLLQEKLELRLLMLLRLLKLMEKWFVQPKPPVNRIL